MANLCRQVYVHIPSVRIYVRPVQASRFSRARSFATQFSREDVKPEEIAKLAAKPIMRLELEDLVRQGPCPLQPEALIRSANFSLAVLPVRLAHRIQALQNLPFIVMSNPYIAQIYQNYLHSLSLLLPFTRAEIELPEEETHFTEVLEELVETHANTIPTLAKGFVECSRYISPPEVTRFLDKHLRARIGTRLIAEQHIALHYESQEAPTDGEKSSYIGVIDTELVPATVIRQCSDFVSDICELKYGVRPKLIVDGIPSTQFAFVPVHLEYIITELLKNAYRATVESGNEKEPIVVTIAAPASDTTKQKGVSSLTIRVRDQGGGISKEVLPDIWTYNFTTFSAHDVVSGNSRTMDALNAISNAGGQTSTIAGLGYGLPLSRAYAEYFGGSISIQSLHGWGTDVYLDLKGIKPEVR